MPVRDHLLQLQRNLYDRFRSSARQSVGNLSPSLRKYFLEYQKEFAGFQSVSNRDELLDAFLQSDVLVCGDYHTLPQAQRTVLRLVRDAWSTLSAQKRPLVLALEMLRPKDESAVKRYLGGEMGEKEFLLRIGFRRHWGFAWENYRPLFEFAREKAIRVVGINAPIGRRKPTLAQRDRFAARTLAQLAGEGSRVLALIGDLHLAQRHLPGALRGEWKKRGERRRLVVVHQNAERLYWKLAATGQDDQIRVVKLRSGVYCVLNTPPWVKLQSYLRWIEHSRSAPMGDAGEYEEDFFDLVGTLSRFLGLSEPPDDDFELRWNTDGLPRRLGRKKFLGRLVKAVGGYYLPESRTVLLSSASVNAAATQAAIYLHACLSGRDRGFEFPAQDFYPAVWVEALGYLGSKILNPHRKCHRPEDFRAASATDRFARIVSDHLDAEESLVLTGRWTGPALPARRAPEDRAVRLYRVARCLGQILGDRLYHAILRHHVSIEEIRALFREPFHDGKKSRSLYLHWGLRLSRTDV